MVQLQQTVELFKCSDVKAYVCSFRQQIPFFVPRVRFAPSFVLRGRAEENVQGANESNFMTKSQIEFNIKISVFLIFKPRWEFLSFNLVFWRQKYFSINLLFRDENGKEKNISQGRARKNETNYIMIFENILRMFMNITSFVVDQILSKAADSTSLQLWGWLSWQSMSLFLR